MVGACLWLSFLTLFAYWNALQAGLVYDDNRAIEENADVTMKTPWSSLLYDDFWGTPLIHSGSHGSYRPLCVATFRMNYAVHGLQPFGYHLVNVILHTITTLIFYKLASRLFAHINANCRKNENGLQVSNIEKSGGLYAATLFAVHPIHTEAVSGVVGRADVGCCLFYLLALLSYIDCCCATSYDQSYHSSYNSILNAKNGLNGNKYVSRRNKGINTKCNTNSDNTCLICSPVQLIVCIMCSLCAVLMKEQGITVIGVCAIYDIFLVNWKLVMAAIRSKRPWKEVLKLRYLFMRLMILAAFGVILILARILIMGSRIPNFSSSDNPAAHCDNFIIRSLTFNYLVAFNAWLLLYPYQLNFDWSMNAIPLVESVYDIRNVATVASYTVLIALLMYIYKCLQDSYSYVEDHGCENGKIQLQQYDQNDNQNGVSYDSLKSNHKKVRQRLHNGNGKVSYDGAVNTRKTASTSNTSADPETQILIMSFALLTLPFLPASNLFFYVGFVVAERILYIPSLGYCLLVALICVLMSKKLRHSKMHGLVTIFAAVLIILYTGKTISRNDDWHDEESLYRSGISHNPPKALANLGNVLSASGEITAAERAYKEALQHRPNMADTHYNLGILLQNSKRYHEALESYKNAIKFRKKLAAAYLNMGAVLEKLEKHQEAEKIYLIGSKLDDEGLKNPKAQQYSVTSILFNLGTLLLRQNRPKEALGCLMNAVNKSTENYPIHSIYNMIGESHSRLNQHLLAQKWYKMALNIKPDHIPAYLTYAKSMAVNDQPKNAEDLYKKAIKVKSNDIDALTHYGQFLLSQNRKAEGADLFSKAANIAPHEPSVIYNAGNAYREAKLYGKAEEYFMQALRLTPKNADVYVNLGALNHIQDKFEEAERYYSLALKLKPNDNILLTNIAKLERRRKKKRNYL